MTKEQFEFIRSVKSSVIQYGFSEDVAAFIGSQFALESAFGTSSLARRQSNYCGMKTPLVRLSVADNQGVSSDTWAEYSGLEWCVCDFVLCLQYYRPGSDIKDKISAYSRFISRFYCLDRDYVSKIESIYSQFKNFKND